MIDTTTWNILIAFGVFCGGTVGFALGVWCERPFDDIVADTDATLDRIDARLHQSPGARRYVTATSANHGPETLATHATRLEAINHLCEVYRAVRDGGPYRIDIEMTVRLGIFGQRAEPWKFASEEELRKQLWEMDLGDGLDYYVGIRDYART